MDEKNRCRSSGDFVHRSTDYSGKADRFRETGTQEEEKEKIRKQIKKITGSSTAVRYFVFRFQNESSIVPVIARHSKTGYN